MFLLPVPCSVSSASILPLVRLLLVLIVLRLKCPHPSMNHVYTFLKLRYWTLTLVVSQTSTLITGASLFVPSNSRGRDPDYAFLLIGQAVGAIGTLCPLFCWLELPLWLPSHFFLLLAFSATLSSYRSVWLIDLKAMLVFVS
ncbi:hypothetical protein Tco_0060598 [Tanacetum coccineum]